MDCGLCWRIGVGWVCKHGEHMHNSSFMLHEKAVVIVNVQVRRYAGAAGVPRRLIYANSVLHGRVAKTEQQSLLVWHTPLLRQLFRVGLRPPGKKS